MAYWSVKAERKDRATPAPSVSHQTDISDPLSVLLCLARADLRHKSIFKEDAP